jgi:hypothetical protein
LVLSLTASEVGCRWLLDRWNELAVIQDGLAWQAPERFKLFRLMGMNEMEVLQAPTITAILQACQMLDSDSGNLVEAYWNELLAANPGWSMQRLQAWIPEMSLPPDETAARQELVDIVKAQTERLEAKLKELEEIAEIEGRYSSHLGAFDFSTEGDRMRRYETTCNRYVDRYFKELMRRMNGDAANHPMRTSTDYMRSRTPVFRQPIRDDGSPEKAELKHPIESIGNRKRDQMTVTEDAQSAPVVVAACSQTPRIESPVENEPKTFGDLDSPQDEGKLEVTPKVDVTAEPRSGRILRNEPKPEVTSSRRGNVPKSWDNSRRARRARGAIERRRGAPELGVALNLAGPWARNLLPVELGV